MADSASEIDLESDASSVDGHTGRCEQLNRQVELLTQQNRMLKTEVEQLKQRNHDLTLINQQLRRNSVSIQAKAEQEEEFISNTLQRQIYELKKDKESLVVKFEEEEERLINELSRKLVQLQKDKERLEKTLAKEQEDQVGKLKRRIDRLESERDSKQTALDQLRREKVELENALEQEQEALVHRLWKKMEKLEEEKRQLQEKLESVSAPISGSPSIQNLYGTSNSASAGLSAQGANQPHHSASICSGMSRSLNKQQVHHQHNHPHHSTLGSLHLGPSPVYHQSTSTTSAGGCGGGFDNQECGGWQSDSGGGHGGGCSVPTPSSPHPSQSPMDLDGIDAGASNSGSIHLSRSDIAASQNPVSSGGASGDGSHRNSYHFQSSSTGTTGGACVGVGTAAYVSRLRDEVNRLRAMLSTTQTDQLARAEQERSAVAENARLRKLLQAEAERRELVFRNFSGSESSLEMEDERQFNEASRGITFSPGRMRTASEDFTLPFYPGPGAAFASAIQAAAAAAASSSSPRPSSPSAGNNPPARYCRECGQSISGHRSTPPPHMSSAHSTRSSGGFIKPSAPRIRATAASVPTLQQPLSAQPSGRRPDDIDDRGDNDNEEEEEDDEDEERCRTPPATARNMHE